MKYWSIGALLFVLFALVIDFSDGKGIKVGGVKIKAPKVPLAPKISVPKGPRFPVILPIPIFLPLGGGFRRLNSNERVKCYTCEGDEKSLCALNPAGNARQVTCQSSYYCSTVRKEFKDDGKLAGYNTTVATETKTASNESTIVVTDGDQKSNETSVIELVEGNSTVVLDISSTTEAAVMETSNSTVIRRKRENDFRVVISRGCKRLDFLDGFALAQRSESDSNATERVYAQLCSSDLCNSGDGRLKCYECTGSGIDHPCMKNPTAVAKAVTCEWNEVCYVDRYIQVSDNSTNSTSNTIRVSRGCRRSSLTVEEEGKIITRDDKLSLSCRLSSFCNSFDANRLVRNSNAAPGVKNAPLLIFIGILTSIILGSNSKP